MIFTIITIHFTDCLKLKIGATLITDMHGNGMAYIIHEVNIGCVCKNEEVAGVIITLTFCILS